jgi:formylglycine-generating enzyme required for sulfatase activity
MFPRLVISGLVVGLAAASATRAESAPGNVNCDATVNGSDVAAFVRAVLDPSGYAAAYPGCSVGNADFNCNGGADAGDIAGFINCLLTGDCPSCTPPGMVLVPTGDFIMGDVWHEGGPEELPVHTVYISAYYIDICELTNQQYADALNWANSQGGQITVSAYGMVFKYNSGNSYPYCALTTGMPSGEITWNGTTFGVLAGRGNHPMNMVSWYGAVAYANWRSVMQGKTPCYDLSTWACDFYANGYRLPTEAEWEKAAAWDPVQSRHFRFAEHTDGCGLYCLAGARANYTSSGDPFEADPFPYTTPVGYYDGSNHSGYQTQDAKSYYGCRDMSGNLWEWCNDWYSATYYATSASKDPHGPASGTLHAMRGGSWFNDPYGLRTARRNYHAPADYNPNDGFRCVCKAQ